MHGAPLPARRDFFPMITSRRDYLLRIIDEVGRLLTRLVFQRRNGREKEALQSVVEACERLFGRAANEVFQFTPEQHFLMLTQGEATEDARAKILLYAALNAEAGHAYRGLGNEAMARNSFLNALRFTLRVEKEFPSSDAPPDYAPKIPELLEALKEQPLDPETTELLRAAQS